MGLLFHATLYVTETAANGDDWDLTVVYSASGKAGAYGWTVNDMVVGTYIPLESSTPSGQVRMYKIKAIADLGTTSHITVEYADTPGEEPTVLPSTQTTLVTTAYPNGLLCPPFFVAVAGKELYVDVFNVEKQTPTEIVSVASLASSIRDVFKAGVLKS